MAELELSAIDHVYMLRRDFYRETQQWPKVLEIHPDMWARIQMDKRIHLLSTYRPDRGPEFMGMRVQYHHVPGALCKL